MLEKHLECLAQKECVSCGIINYVDSGKNIWAHYTSSRGRYRFADGVSIGYHLFNTGNAALKTKWFAELGGQDPAMTHYGGGDTEFAVRLKDRFNPVFVNNKKALAFSEMKKDLDTALDQMVEFGRYNLPYLHQKHPAHRQLYGMAAMIKYRFLLKVISFPPVIACVRSAARMAPRSLSGGLIRYCVVSSVFRGFNSAGVRG